MLITRRSSLSGHFHSMEIDVTEEQINTWRAGALIQHVMPNLTATEREFLKTGASKEEWDDIFGSIESG